MHNQFHPFFIWDNDNNKILTSDRTTCTETIKKHAQCQSSLSSLSSSSSSPLCHVPGLFYMSSPYFDHKISKYFAWSRFQIVLQLLTNNVRRVFLHFVNMGNIPKDKILDKSLSVFQPPKILQFTSYLAASLTNTYC